MNARYEQLDLSATDYPLYDGHPPSEHGSDTSMAAATEIEAVGPLLRRAVYAWVCRRGERGATCDEVEVAMGMPHQTASARLRELEMLGQLDKTNEKRRTRTGRWARVYRGDGK